MMFSAMLSISIPFMVFSNILNEGAGEVSSKPQNQMIEEENVSESPKRRNGSSVTEGCVNISMDAMVSSHSSRFSDIGV